MGTTIRGSTGARLAVQLAMAAAAIWWLLYWFFQPITATNNWLNTIDNKVKSKFQGMRGSLFLLQVLPIIVIAFLSYFVLELRRRLLKPTAKELADGRRPRIKPWSLPVFVKCPFFGMLTVGDLVFILVILFIVLWFFIKFSVTYVNEINHTPVHEGGPPRWVHRMGKIGVLFGSTAVIPIALLWLPVSRGSAILHVIGVPYERAVKYHTWLGFLTIWLLIFHGSLITGHMIHGHSTKELITWAAKGQDVSVVAGVVALSAGIIMMLTALERARRRFFELFFASHHLYLVFLIFFGFHCVSRVMYIIVPVLLFFLDRFIRAVQSRKAVDVLSAKVYKSGIIELKFPKAANSTYHALSFVYVLLPSVSRLHWHPFSVASSPLDGTNEIAIYIKPLGGFTKNLHDALINSQSSKPGRELYKCPFSCKVGLDGPYGDESAFYLRYKNLVLVAGGIGVTPFLAIIRDILYRYRLQQVDLPSSVQLIFCVRNATELHILDALAPSSILPGYEEHLTIRIEAYVTSKSASAEDNSTISSTNEKDMATGEEVNYIDIHKSIVEVSMNPSQKSAREMSPISSSGHAAWVAATLVSTIAGFFVINGIFNVTTPLKTNPLTSLTNYDRVFIYIAAVTVAVVIFGGAVILLWFLFEDRARKLHSKVTSQELSTASSPVCEEKTEDIETSVPTDDIWRGNVTYGRRPNWHEFFGNLAIMHEGHDVGVLVSGGGKMQEEVASKCRDHSLSRASTVVMHYHSVSFDL